MTLSVRKGEVVAVIGPSGSGKSTLLRCFNHLVAPDSGVVWIEGKPIGLTADGAGGLRAASESETDRQRRRTGMVFQRFNLFEHLTARENVSLAPARLLGESRAAARQEAGRLLAQLGLAGKEDSYPAQLSGGQKQRVAIARALALRPAVLLFDEPTSALDPESASEVLAAMRALAQGGSTMIVVTHEMAFARAVASRIVTMERGQIVSDRSAA